MDLTIDEALKKYHINVETPEILQENLMDAMSQEELPPQITSIQFLGGHGDATNFFLVEWEGGYKAIYINKVLEHKTELFMLSYNNPFMSSLAYKDYCAYWYYVRSFLRKYVFNSRDDLLKY